MNRSYSFFLTSVNFLIYIYCRFIILIFRNICLKYHVQRVFYNVFFDVIKKRWDVWVNVVSISSIRVSGNLKGKPSCRAVSCICHAVSCTYMRGCQVKEKTWEEMTWAIAIPEEQSNSCFLIGKSWTLAIPEKQQLFSNWEVMNPCYTRGTTAVF